MKLFAVLVSAAPGRNSPPQGSVSLLWKRMNSVSMKCLVLPESPRVNVLLFPRTGAGVQFVLLVNNLNQRKGGLLTRIILE